MNAWSFACPDWQDRIRQGRSLVPDLPLFKEHADLAVSIFNALRLPDVPGTPLLHDASGDWFRDIVAAIFGSRDPTTGVRHVREVFCLVPKGNSKTTYGAEAMLTALIVNTRPRAEFLLIGPTQAIADLAFSQIQGSIELDAELLRRFQIRDHLKEVVDRKTKAKLKVKTFGLDILTGPRPVGVMLDEVHLLGKIADASKVIRQLRGGLEKSTEGFLLMISTQSDQPPTGAFRDELTMARSVRDGRFDGRVLPVLYEFPDDIAVVRNDEVPKWFDPACWHMVMPNLGRSLQLNSLVADWNTERTKGEHAVQVWASQHLNIEIGLGLKTNRWRGADYWQAAAEPGLTLDALIAASEVIVVGIDGGGLDDMLGLAVIGRETGTRRWLHWGRAWIHPVVFDRRKSEASAFGDYVAAGDLVVCDDMEAAFADLAEVVAIVEESGLLAQVGLDPMGVGAIVDALAEKDITGDDRVVGIAQGWTLNGAIKTAEVKLANRTFVHCGQSLLAYAVSNAKAEPKGNAITITKQLAGAGKIDPLMAAFNAVALMSRNPVPKFTRSVYEERGILFL